MLTWHPEPAQASLLADDQADTWMASEGDDPLGPGLHFVITRLSAAPTRKMFMCDPYTLTVRRRQLRGGPSRLEGLLVGLWSLSESQGAAESYLAEDLARRTPTIDVTPGQMLAMGPKEDGP